MEQSDRSPEENEQQSKEMSRLDDVDAVLGYDFEVKEQDRWLPIANGESSSSAVVLIPFPGASARPCATRLPLLSIDLCARPLDLHAVRDRPIP